MLNVNILRAVFVQPVTLTPQICK